MPAGDGVGRGRRKAQIPEIDKVITSTGDNEVRGVRGPGKDRSNEGEGVGVKGDGEMRNDATSFKVLGDVFNKEK